MITVRDKLVEQADTQAERDLLAMWLSEERDEMCARQRAWEQVQQRGNWARVTFNW